MGSSAASPPSSSARASFASSSSRRTSGSTTGTFTSSATSATRSSAPRTAPRFHDSQAAHSQENHRPAGLHHASAAAPTSFSPVSRRFGYLATLDRCGLAPHEREEPAPISAAGTHLQPGPRRAQIHAGQAPLEHLLDLELSVGSATRSGRNGESLLHHDRSPQRVWPSLRDAGVERGALPARHRRDTGIVSTARRLSFQKTRAEKRRDIRSRSSSASTRPATSCRSTSAFSPTPTR